ncbi:MAG TPA: MOSC domain-containing protein [Aestuariivirga sp.]
MPQLLSKAPFVGRTKKLLLSADREKSLEKAEVARLELLFSGIKGDFHGGLTRKSDVRTIKQYPRDTDIRNVRQLTLVSEEELADIAKLMGIPEMKAEWLGANIVTSGIPDLTMLTPSTRMQFPSGATGVVDMENFPCRQVADVVAQHYPEPEAGLVTSAIHKRGLTAWVEREGVITAGDEIILWVPQQRLYAHMGP